MEISRNRIIITACAAVLFIATGLGAKSYFQPDRRLARAWQGFISSIEARKATATANYLAGNYTDSWGYTQPALAKDLPRIFHTFSTLKLTLPEVSTMRAGDSAVITARVRMTASGHGFAADAMQQVNNLAEPFVVTWRQDKSFPYAWRIVRIEQPHFDASRYPRGSGFF